MTDYPDYPCPNCEQELRDLISFKNLLDHYGRDKILSCPHCGIKLVLDYDEYVGADGFDEEYWSFKRIL